MVLGITCIVVALIVVVLALALRTARDDKLERFKFRFYGRLPGTFGIEVESLREPTKPPPGLESVGLPPGPEPARLPPGEADA